MIVGGGSLGLQKIASLTPSGAEITVVAPRMSGEIRTMASRLNLQLIERLYDPADLLEKALVFAATGDRDLNHRIVGDARAARIPANAVDDPGSCDFFTPSILRRGSFILAISSSGRFPGISKALRETLEAWLPEEDEALLEALFELRRALREAALTPTARSAALRELIGQFKRTYLEPGAGPVQDTGSAAGA